MIAAMLLNALAAVLTAWQVQYQRCSFECQNAT